MEQSKRRDYLIRYLKEENPKYAGMEVPGPEAEKKRLLRALMNVRMPAPISEEFLKVQDEYLAEAAREKGIVRLEDTERMEDGPCRGQEGTERMAGGLCLWQGDITRLAVDAIVNAANSGLTGCYQPNHACIDNCIHTFAGVQLRLACSRLMEEQGHEEETGRAKITPAYNLPCRYVLHTVGPIIYDRVRAEDERLLASCYRSCLKLARENGLKSVAFCCISTGVFRFPNRRAAEIAVETVREFLRENGTGMSVVFNVFKDEDYAIYRELLGEGGK